MYNALSKLFIIILLAPVCFNQATAYQQAPDGDITATSAASKLYHIGDENYDLTDREQRDSLEKYAKITHDLAEKQGHAEHVLLSANRLADIYENKGDYRRALEYYKSARSAEAALHKESAALGLKETEKLKSEYTAQLAAALEHQQDESRKSTLLIVGIFTLAVVSKTFLLYIIIRRKKSHNKELRLLLDQVERQNLQLDEGSRFKQHLISVVAHDLRTPVASIVSLLKMFEDGYLSEQETRDMLQKARKEMDTLKKFLEELLTWIVGQREGLSSASETFNIGDMIGETVDMYQRPAQEKNVRIEVEHTPAIFVHADKQMMKITINNLLNNALKFCEAEDQIYLSVKKSGEGKVRVMVRDTGIGFSTKIEKKLTEFSQKGVLGTWGEKATGIGLSLCILYLNANNSHLNLKSEPGQGAQFWFDLDVASEKVHFRKLNKNAHA